MPVLQRRPAPTADLRKAAQKVSPENMAHPMIKVGSQTSSSDEDMDLTTPKQLSIPATTTHQMPMRYESDEESVSPCPDDFEDDSFFDVAFDSSIDLDFDESPSILEAVSMPVVRTTSKPLLVNVAKLAPMDKRATRPHERPVVQHAQPMAVQTKTSIGRPVIVTRTAQPASPSVITLSKPPRGFKAPPPVPARSHARLSPTSVSPTTPVALPQQVQAPTHPQRQAPEVPRRSAHAHWPSFSSVSTADSSIAEEDDNCSVASSAPTSVADDEEELAARRDSKNLRDAIRKHEADLRRDSVAIVRGHDADLERAIEDYMNWRSEGSPTNPSDMNEWKEARISPRTTLPPPSIYRLERRGCVVETGSRIARKPVTGPAVAAPQNQQMSSDEDTESVDESEEEWVREIERGLATPTPTSYAAYDPFGISPPRLPGAAPPMPTGPVQGLRRGLGKVRRAI